MSISTGIEVIQILEGGDASRGTIEAMAGAWQDGVLTRAVLVTPPPTPRLADLLRRIAGNVDLVQVAEGTRFLDRLRAGLERTTGATVAVVADDVEVYPGWWAPLSKALEGGAAISIARLAAGGPGQGPADRGGAQHLPGGRGAAGG